MEIAPDCKFNGTGASLACGLFRRRFAAVWLSDDSFLRDPLISWGNAATWDGFRTHFSEKNMEPSGSASLNSSTEAYSSRESLIF